MMSSVPSGWLFTSRCQLSDVKGGSCECFEFQVSTAKCKSLLTGPGFHFLGIVSLTHMCQDSSEPSFMRSVTLSLPGST